MPLKSATYRDQGIGIGLAALIRGEGAEFYDCTDTRR